MKKLKRTLAIIAILFVMFVLVVIELFTNPLRRTEERIEEMLKEIIPLGVCFEDALSILESSMDIEIVSINNDRGFIIGPSGPTMGGSPCPQRTLVGEKAIRLYLGTYLRFFVEVEVGAFIVFNEHSELTKIIDRKGAR